MRPSPYSIVLKELDDGKISRSLWLQAQTEHPSDERKAKALYVKLRVKQIKYDINTERIAGTVERLGCATLLLLMCIVTSLLALIARVPA